MPVHSMTNNEATLSAEEHGPGHIPRFQTDLKQWRTLLAVVRHGSFANAASHLNVSQPAISYTIAKMEDQLGMCLLQHKGRRAELTESGHFLLERARHLLLQAAALERTAESIRLSVRPVLAIGVESDFFIDWLLPKLKKFSLENGSSRIRLTELSSRGLEENLCAQTIDLGIACRIPPGFLGEHLLETKYVPVAHPDHPLHQLNRPLIKEDLEREVQIVTDRSGLSEANPDLLAAAGIQWKVNSIVTVEAAVMENLGYAWLPMMRVEAAIKRRQLALLPLAEGQVRMVQYFAIYARPEARQAKAFCGMLKHASTSNMMNSLALR
ncbi:DNA-binding transcriptional regulator, LysR family [Noviherbaspirillum humi]|uniref:DNA-binding transcriptional regulator, LysR family n=1 Tax=Noviherbaspirillum humi TaxID=1688639 RepID=A0A239GBR6_9BURK|nr:LysR family transcriptional regulator [Noviherbaspirillum humi]SNS65494.1 DNA-binding transcriptional regulator, LysR family [Noviherbaspirillum humi]